jgi:hypothetical protein
MGQPVPGSEVRIAVPVYPAELQELTLGRRRRCLPSYSDLFRHSGKLDNRLSFHLVHDLSAMHLDGGFTASQLSCDLLVQHTLHD